MLTAAVHGAQEVPVGRAILGDSVLSSSFGPRELDCIERLGEVVEIPSGTIVFERGAPADFLYVVLDGALLPVTQSGKAPAFWVGPGDVCCEGGWVVDSPHSTTMMAFGPAPRFFRLHREALAQINGPVGTAVTRMLAAIARVFQVRLEALPTAAAAWTEADYCDEGHPLVRAMARRLARGTQLETACAIWAEIWKMPYRFGSWQWTASDTIARGHGMCTTKAVLQTTLMRILGIEAGYVKATLDGALVRACMPRVYHPRFQRPAFKHYYAAARIGGRWIPLDASFSVGSLSLIAETEHHVKPFVSWDARVEGFAEGTASLGGLDPYAIEVHPEICDVMRKTPTYDAKNAHAMNVRLDRAQGFKVPAPLYVARAKEALAHGSSLAARTLMLEGLTADVASLRARRANAVNPLLRE